MFGLFSVPLLRGDSPDPSICGSERPFREAAVATSRTSTRRTGMEEAMIVVETSAAPQIARLPPSSKYVISQKGKINAFGEAYKRSRHDKGCVGSNTLR